jgi:anaerobic C4-dicarboxylate transporter
MAVVKHSAGILREHPVSVTGYLTLRGLVGAIPSFIAMGLFLVAVVVSSKALMYALMLLGVLAFLIGLPVATVFGFAYHVAYYSKLPSTPSLDSEGGNSVIEV